MTLLSCMLCGRVRGMGSLRKKENGSMSYIPLNLKVTDEFVKQNVLDFISGI